MNDFDSFSDRLDELGRSAPVPVGDPHDDIRRGQRALRRRRARGVAGIATAVVAVGAVSAAVYLPGGSNNPDGGAALPHIEVGSGEVSGLCVDKFGGRSDVDASGEPLMDEPSVPVWEHPSVAAQLEGYRQAAAAILDPSGSHLEARVTNAQTVCDAAADQLAKLGTKLGWSSSGVQGVVQLEVVSNEFDVESDIFMLHDRWTTVEGALPAGVTQAQTVEYKDGRAVSVQRQDGQTVSVEVNGTWGNNLAPGTSPATDLPSTDRLLELAASESLALPQE